MTTSTTAAGSCFSTAAPPKRDLGSPVPVPANGDAPGSNRACPWWLATIRCRSSCGRHEQLNQTGAAQHRAHGRSRPPNTRRTVMSGGASIPPWPRDPGPPPGTHTALAVLGPVATVVQARSASRGARYQLDRPASDGGVSLNLAVRAVRSPPAAGRRCWRAVTYIVAIQQVSQRVSGPSRRGSGGLDSEIGPSTGRGADPDPLMDKRSEIQTWTTMTPTPRREKRRLAVPEHSATGVLSADMCRAADEHRHQLDGNGRPAAPPRCRGAATFRLPVSGQGGAGVPSPEEIEHQHRSRTAHHRRPDQCEMRDPDHRRRHQDAHQETATTGSSSRRAGK